MRSVALYASVGDPWGIHYCHTQLQNLYWLLGLFQSASAPFFRDKMLASDDAAEHSPTWRQPKYAAVNGSSDLSHVTPRVRQMSHGVARLKMVVLFISVTRSVRIAHHRSRSIMASRHRTARARKYGPGLLLNDYTIGRLLALSNSIGIGAMD